MATNPGNPPTALTYLPYTGATPDSTSLMPVQVVDDNGIVGPWQLAPLSALAPLSGNGIFNPLDPTYGASGDGIHDDAAAVLAAATAAAAVGGVLLLPGGSVFRMAHDVTLPYGAYLVSTGGYLDVAVGSTLTINAALPQEQVKIFSATSTIIFSDRNSVAAFVGWWGARPDASSATNKAAIQAALNSYNRATTVWMAAGQYNVDGEIDFLREGVCLRGAAPSAAWGGYVLGGTSIYFTSGTYGFSLLGTQLAPGAGISDGSSIRDMEIKSSVANGVGTGITFKGPKFFENLSLSNFANYGIQCVDYGIQFRITNCYVNNVGPLVAQSGRAIQVDGANTTIYQIEKCSINGCYYGIELKAGINASLTETTIETCTSTPLYLHNVTGQSLGRLWFENVWCENNATGGFQLVVDTSGSSAPWYPFGLTFQTCRLAGVLAGQRSVNIGANCSGPIVFTQCALGGGSGADTASFNSFTSVIDPADSFVTDSTSLYNIVRSASAVSIVQSPSGNQICSAGVLPASFSLPDGKTVTVRFTSGANASGLFQLADQGTGASALAIFGTTTTTVVSDSATILQASSSPTAGHIGVWKPTSDTLSFANNVGGARAVTVMIFGPNIVAMSDPV